MGIAFLFLACEGTRSPVNDLGGAGDTTGLELTGGEDFTQAGEAQGEEVRVAETTLDDLPADGTVAHDINSCEEVVCPPQCLGDDDCEPGFVCDLDVGCCPQCVPGEDPCATVDCIWQCDLDSDCGTGEECLFYGEGCCSECAPFCELCYMSAGEYCNGTPPDELCEVGKITVVEVGTCWFEISYAGEDGTDVFLANGCEDFAFNLEVNACGFQFDADQDLFTVACNWCGPVKYTQDFCQCVPACEGKQCGDDGCGGSCGVCADGCTCIDGQCAGCGEDVVKLDPLCVHFPAMVPAGTPFPVAVYGMAQCAVYDHYEVTAEGTSYTVELFGTMPSWGLCIPLETCSEEEWVYSGIVWLEAPNPGAYTVTVGDFMGVVGATGGLIGEPACQDDCGTPLLENFAWLLKILSSDEIAGTCLTPGSGQYVGTPMEVSGTCQNYSLGAILELPQMPLKHCNDGELFFGQAAPYWMDATVCGTNPMVDGHPTVIVGTIQGAFGAPVDTQAFVVEGTPLWNE